MTDRLVTPLRLTIIYVLSLLVLFAYSYTQVDLNLTLSSNAVYQSVQRQLLLLGYFHRPTSAFIFLLLVASLTSCEIGFLHLARRKRLQPAAVWRLAIISSILLVVSYPAFSHDIFNYMFDARILVTHGADPWRTTALDFPWDEWTRFMRWTHRTYPYGPVWLPLTLPFYIAGLGKFTLTLFWFKSLAAASYLVSVRVIRSMLAVLDHKHESEGMLLYALNPLILIESLVSSHIDAVMTAVFLTSFYLVIVKKRRLASFVSLIISAGVKYVTAAAVPVWLWWKLTGKKTANALPVVLLFLLLATIGEISFREILPWYFIPLLAIAALMPKRKELATLAVALSFGLLLRYTPHLYKGDYSQWVLSTREIVTWLPPVVLSAWLVWKKRSRLFPASQ